MRRFDKLDNIAKANILTEQRYLAERMLDELSPELKQRAFNQADAESQKHGNEMGGEHNVLKSDRRMNQANTIGTQVNNNLKAEAQNIGTYLGLDGDIQKDPYHNKVYLIFRKKTPDSADRILGYDISKNEIKPFPHNNVQAPDNIGRRIERLAYKIQANEIASEKPDNEL